MATVGLTRPFVVMATGWKRRPVAMVMIPQAPPHRVPPQPRPFVYIPQLVIINVLAYVSYAAHVD